MKGMFAVLLVLGLQCALGQKLTGDDILRKAEQNFQGITDYTVTLDVVTDLERMKIPPMHVTMYYKQPDKVHFDAKGFVVLPRDGMGVQFGQLTRKYAVDSITRESVNGVAMYRLVLRSRDEKALMRPMQMWVDATRWTPERIHIAQPNGAAMEAIFNYGKINQFWLPQQLVVSFSTAVKDTSGAAPPANPFTGGASMPARGFSRAGTVTVRYSEYRLNTGLPDSIFVQEQRK
jgi:outer membrane lipoprotein-sorting protein